jgi:hypothetical protein
MSLGLSPKHEDLFRSSTNIAKLYGDASYGTADLVEKFETSGIEANTKVQPPSPPRVGMFSQDDFDIDPQAGTVRCPRGAVMQLRRKDNGATTAEFAVHCQECPMRAQCTHSKRGRRIETHPKHDVLVKARTRQPDSAWRARYRATRPKVERKITHLMRHKHGGRRARVRGCVRIAHDFALLAAAVNLARVAVLRTRTPTPAR